MKSGYLIFTVLAALAALAAACGSDDEDTGAAPSPSPTPAATTAPTAPDRTVAPIEGRPGGKIAFVTFRDGPQEIYVINADGTGERNLTNNPDGDDYDPDWSPDGRQLAFVSNRTGRTHIFTIDADGSNLRQVTPADRGGLAPRWSSDGRKIAFSRGGSVWVHDLDTGEERMVMESQHEATADRCRAGAYPGGWSPDDELITYYSASVTHQEGQVCLVRADGSEVEVLIDIPGIYSVEPVWTRDGRYIVYRGIDEDGVHDIWVLDRETGERTNITSTPETDIEPDVSPDGGWIVFGRLETGARNFDLYIMRIDGSDLHWLTGSTAKEAYPVWAP